MGGGVQEGVREGEEMLVAPALDLPAWSFKGSLGQAKEDCI